GGWESDLKSQCIKGTTTNEHPGYIEPREGSNCTIPPPGGWESDLKSQCIKGKTS
ncbi:3068_t:CDS:2, partial [Funneliformis mosseae]